VPSPFLSAITKGHTMSFHAKRKLTAQDIDALYESGLNDLMMEGRCVRRSAMYFTLGDNRKYFSADDVYGMPTTMLKGALCYYFVSEYFYSFITDLLESMGFYEVKFIPSTLAQAIYLLPEKKREGYAFLLDIGFVTSSISVVYGNGIVHEENFNCGIASVLVGLIETFKIDFNVAGEMLALANISGGNVPKDLMFNIDLVDQSFSVQTINDMIKQGLDEPCERIDVFLRK
jgi:cell division ATPase FtsA